MSMAANQKPDDRKLHGRPEKDEGNLERMAKKIDPPGKEITNEDLPMTPDATPTDNRS